MLELRHISKAYGNNQVLQDINLNCSAGESLVLVGESGSGKTTIAKLIAGMEKPDTGEVNLAGRPLAGSFRQRSFADCARIQYIFQDPYSVLEPKFTVEKVFAETERICRRNRWPYTPGREALSYVDASLVPYLDKPVGELSGGQRQKVCIARALIPNPQVMIADEATSMLDRQSTLDIFDLLHRIKADRGIVLIMIMHDLDFSYDKWDRIAVLAAGKLVEELPFADFYTQARHGYSKELIAAYRFFQEARADEEGRTAGDCG